MQDVGSQTSYCSKPNLLSQKRFLTDLLVNRDRSQIDQMRVKRNCILYRITFTAGLLQGCLFSPAQSARVVQSRRLSSRSTTPPRVPALYFRLCESRVARLRKSDKLPEAPWRALPQPSFLLDLAERLCPLTPGRESSGNSNGR